MNTTSRNREDALEHPFRDLERYADRTALIDDAGNHLSYAEMIARGDHLLGGLQGRQLVLVVCHNSPAAISGYVAMQRAGHVTMLVSHKTPAATLENLVSAFRPGYIYMPTAIDPSPLGRMVQRLDTHALLATGLDKDFAMHDDLVALLPTSGSTGSPEYVRISRTNLAANTRSIIDYLGIESTDRAITTMPMSYSYGLSIINTHLASGASLVATESSLMERSFWNLIRQSRATTFGGVPYIYQMLKRLRFEQMTLPDLRYITQAGGKLGVELTREFAEVCQRKRIDFITMYGQTEATARIAYVPPAQAISKAGAIGVAIPGGRLRLADPDSGESTTADEGEIVYEGKNVSLGNARSCHDLAGPDTRHGVLYTGDIGRRDADGYYYVVGRKSRVLKLYGNRVNLDELEQLLVAGGLDVACAGTDDMLVIYTTDGNCEPAIRQRISKHTDIGPRAYRVVRIEQVPRNESGKIQYARLNELDN